MLSHCFGEANYFCFVSLLIIHLKQKYPYIVIFSKDSATAPIRVLRATKREKSYFFGKGYISESFITNLTSTHQQHTLGDYSVSLTGNQLKIDGQVYCTIPPNHTVKLYNTPAIGIYNSTGTLVRAIYPDGKDIINNPGQTVFPGGKKEETETIEAAAIREFKEECGQDKVKMAIINSPSQQTHTFGENFGVLYVKITHTNLNTLKDSIHLTLSKTPIYERLAELQDDELASVEIVNLDTAIAGFTSDPINSKDLSWYREAGDYLKTLFP